MNIKKMTSKINKLYNKNNIQRLYVTSIDGITKEDCVLDIFACDKNGNEDFYLFTIVSDECRIEHELDFKDNIYKIYDDYSYKPYYLNQEFYVRKRFIESEDIYKCTKYFIKSVLEMWLICNIEVL